MAVGWSPFGSNSDTDLKGRPPSDFGGFGGLTGVKLDSGTNSGRRGPRPPVIGFGGVEIERLRGFREAAFLA